ncbi:glycosyltransferase family 39 protein [bacterium]|nr:glycosyltransferase family 39 protein [bacterium]
MKKWWQRNWQIIVILGLALLLRLPLLGGSFWLDEAAQAWESARPWNQQLAIKDDFQPPLLHVLTWAAMKVSESEWWLRTWGALLPGLLTVAAVYLLGQKLVSKRTGVVASLFLATSGFHVFFSQELRPYSWAACLAAWSWLFLLEYMRVGHDFYQWPARWREWSTNWPVNRELVFFWLGSIAGIYTMYLYPFVLAGQLLWLVVRGRWRVALVSGAVVTLAFLPWAPSFAGQWQAGQQLRADFVGWEQMVSFPAGRAMALTVAKFLFGMMDVEVNAIFVTVTLLVAVLAAVAALGWGKKFWQEGKETVLIALFASVVPFLLAAIVSVWVPVIQPKRVMFALAWWCLMLAMVAMGKRGHKQKFGGLSLGLVGLLLSINLISVYQYWTRESLQRENWRGAIEALHAWLPTQSSLAFFTFPAPFSPWNWYEPRMGGTIAAVATGTFDTKNDLSWQNIQIDDFEYIVTFDYMAELTDSQRLLPQFLREHGFYHTELEWSEPNLGTVRVWAK